MRGHRGVFGTGPSSRQPAVVPTGGSAHPTQPAAVAVARGGEGEVDGASLQDSANQPPSSRQHTPPPSNKGNSSVQASSKGQATGSPKGATTSSPRK